ncbi:hypothetical protein IFHNHDMJ_00549 [Synechococcus sp. CBW1107]|nr:hypothetical protein IFHNHDMJ_00549 [Synechococcus sp. CBW1107]
MLVRPFQHDLHGSRAGFNGGVPPSGVNPEDQAKPIYDSATGELAPLPGSGTAGERIPALVRQGPQKVDGEWHLIAATHNLFKLLRFRRSRQ